MSSIASLAMFASLTPQAAARDLAAMNGDDISVLEQRLTDAGCYTGPIDGRASPAVEAAKKACPDQEPILRIETGMHVAPIRQIGVDAQCRIAATGSDDKTVRIWSLPDGRLIRTQRLAIGEGDYGKIFVVAVSPDGRFVAAGGFDAHEFVDRQMGVYLFDTATGTSVRRLGLFGQVIKHLAFSSDGAKLAVALGATQGIRVLDVASGREIMADRDFEADSYGVAFGPDGALYATGYDGFLRRYGADLHRTAKVIAPGGKEPHSIAVDPSGQKVAVGYSRTVAVDVLDARTLHSLAIADTPIGERVDLDNVAWMKTGGRLVAGGSASILVDGKRVYVLRSFSPDGRKAGPDVLVADNSFSSLVSCGEILAFATHDPLFGLLRTDGKAVILQKGRSFDARAKVGAAFTLSSDATRLRFGLGYGNDQPIVFDLKAGTLRTASASVADLGEPIVTKLPVADWLHKARPLFNGRPIGIDARETSESLAQRADRSGFVLGGNFYLRAFAADGVELWKKPIPGAAYGVNLDGAGKIVVVAYGDGTIRWHRWSDGQELLALFVDAKDRRWVVWTPSGYYMASPGGEDLIGWHVNRGWSQPADFFSASRFRARFNRPDIVQMMLDTLDEETAVKQANETARRRDETKPISAALPPVITIVSSGADASFTGSGLNLTYSLRSPSGLPIDKVDILLDGSPTGARGPGLDTRAGAREIQQTITIGLPPRDIDVALVAKSGTLVSEIVHVKLVYRGATPPPQEADALKPALYALLVGIANYQDPKLHLDYSAKDAIDLATALKAQAGGLYRDVKVKVVTDKDATATGVKDGLLWLQKETTSRDLAIVFLAGHGVTDTKNEFWFLPYEADPARLYSTAVSRHDIVDVLHDLPGKKILLLDACHAGAVLPSGVQTRGAPVDLNSTINDFATAESGLVVYGASTGRELSVESDEWKHGAFTKALIEAIGEGKADIGHRGKITTALLDSYLAERVKELTDGGQHPVMSRPDAVPDFPLALVR